MSQISDFALDALGEIGNIGSGNAATALSQMIGRSVDLAVPDAQLVPLGEAAEKLGPAETEVVAVLTPVKGDLEGQVLLVFDLPSALKLCNLLGIPEVDEMGMSALREIGNILTAAYLTAIGQLTNLQLEPEPPLSAHNWLGSIVDESIAMSVIESDHVMMLQTGIVIEGEASNFSFLFVAANGPQKLLAGLGIAA